MVVMHVVPPQQKANVGLDVGYYFGHQFLVLSRDVEQVRLEHQDLQERQAQQEDREGEAAQATPAGGDETGAGNQRAQRRQAQKAPIPATVTLPALLESRPSRSHGYVVPHARWSRDPPP